jgi:hypothetical protein
MTHRPSTDPARDPEAPLSPAESEAVGERIRALAGGLDAPPALRTWVRAAETARGPGRAPRRPRLALAGAGGLVAAAAAALVIALIGAGGGTPAPSVDAAASLALARPTAAAPAPTGPADTHLAARVGEVTFPNYAYQWPAWKAAGVRHDTVGGRNATTVTYRGPAGDVGYTIVDGAPLAEPAGARRVTAEGVPMRVFRKDGATIVTWRRGGHTCILAGRGRGAEARLVQLATWA